jgi:hypothetical protein
LCSEQAELATTSATALPFAWTASRVCTGGLTCDIQTAAGAHGMVEPCGGFGIRPSGKTGWRSQRGSRANAGGQELGARGDRGADGVFAEPADLFASEPCAEGNNPRFVVLCAERFRSVELMRGTVGLLFTQTRAGSPPNRCCLPPIANVRDCNGVLQLRTLRDLAPGWCCHASGRQVTERRRRSAVEVDPPGAARASPPEWSHAGLPGLARLLPACRRVRSRTWAGRFDHDARRPSMHGVKSV